MVLATRRCPPVAASAAPFACDLVGTRSRQQCRRPPGVDPKVGLYASFSIAVTIAFTGGRPAMISAATGAMALVMIPLVRDHGVEYLFAATILTGVFQYALGALGVGRLMRFIPRTVMVGFVNALAILIFHAQLDHVFGEGLGVYAMIAAGLGIIYGLPRLTTVVPAPLVAIVVLTTAAIAFDLRLPNVGDMGELPSTLPFFGLPAVPFTFETLSIVAPVALTLAMIGLLESLLTAQLIDDITDTRSDKDRESRGQGIANVATGFLGGMAGCAMIGQSMINVKSGGRSPTGRSHAPPSRASRVGGPAASAVARSTSKGGR